VFLQPAGENHKAPWVQFEPELVEKPTRRDREMLIVHANYLEHLKS
jgi:hypothetical protein